MLVKWKVGLSDDFNNDLFVCFNVLSNTFVLLQTLFLGENMLSKQFWDKSPQEAVCIQTKSSLK